MLIAQEVTGAGGGDTHTLACKVESSVGGRGNPVAAPACPGHDASVRTFLCCFGKCLDSGSGKKRKERKGGGGKPGCGYSASTRKGGKTQTRPGSGHQEKSGRCRAPCGRLVHAFLQAPCCSRPASRGVPRSGTGFLSYLGVSLTLLEPAGREEEEKKAEKLKQKCQGRPAASQRSGVSGSLRMQCLPARRHPQSAAASAESSASAVKMRGGGTMNL